MLRIHGDNHKTPEYAAAEWLGRLACESCPEIDNSREIVLELFPSVMCFGQKVQEIDLLIFYADYRSSDKIYKTKNGLSVHSFCATVELKGTSLENVTFDGPKCSVFYNGEPHDVTAQSEKQKYALRKYIERNRDTSSAPWIINLIWLRRVNSASLPKVDTNIVGMDVDWPGFLQAASMLAGNGRNRVLKTFSSRSRMSNVTSIFSRRLEPSQLDRKRLEAITRSVLDRTTEEKIGAQLVIYRGRGGTGKTVRLIRIAYQEYHELGLRVLLLTYNKALVADLTRLLSLLGVKNAIGEGGIAVKTIHSFMYEWLRALGVITKEQPDFISNYEQHKQEALSLLKAGAISSDDLAASRAKASRDLAWDLVLIDESQDWPVTERDIIYQLYGHRKVIIADGIDQFVRGVARINWEEGLNGNEFKKVPLRKSLRLKASLCHAIAHFAEEIEYEGWNLEPLPEAQGGKVVVVVGNGLSCEFHHRLSNAAKSDGNEHIDMLFCVPPSWVETLDENRKQSTVAKAFRSWGWEVWDGVDPALRDEGPTSLKQFRIVQYDSCRGLEGWVVVCFGLDEFFEYKKSTAEISDTEKSDMFYEEEAAAIAYAKRWLMIPLTRAIDTLVIHVSDESSYVGGVLKELHGRYPEDIQWVQYD